MVNVLATNAVVRFLELQSGQIKDYAIDIGWFFNKQTASRSKNIDDWLSMI